MALTAQRWLAAAIIGALLSVAYFLSGSEQGAVTEDPRSILLERERRMNDAGIRAADRLRVVTLADSVGRALRSVEVPDSMRMVIGAGVPAMAHAALRNTVRQARETLGDRSLLIDVAVVSDAGSTVRGVNRGVNPWISADFILPAAAGDRCMVLARIHSRGPDAPSDYRVRHALSAVLSEKRLLGPCAYVAAFGRPGPHVAQWLRNGAWGFTLRNSWTEQSPPWTPPSWFGVSRSEMDWPLRYHLPLAAIRCLTGLREDCSAIATHPRGSGSRGRYPDIWGNRFITAGTIGEHSWQRLSLGPNGSSVLSDAVHALGPERFQRFWSSDAPVPEAFRAAAGIELGDFMHAWMTRQYAIGRRGPQLPSSSVPTGLALVGVGAAVAVVAARRRQVN